MGATNARHEDASLNLAVPTHYSVGHRRLLDPKQRRCKVCQSKFTPLLDKKHYCRRCGAIVCEHCTHLRSYKSREQPRFKICRKCDLTPNLIQVLPQKIWHLVISFAGNRAHNNSLQTCKKLQLAVPLPYPWGPGWDAFFTEGTFLSKGANGSVFKCAMKSDPLRKPVAVKVIQKSTVYSLRKWHHINREVDCLKACKHKHVIDLLFVAQCPDAVFMVLEFAQGGDLFDWLVTRRQHSEGDVKPLAFQLMSALTFLHEDVNAVHRDIKPENILLEKRIRSEADGPPCIKLADFGFARRVVPPPQGGKGKILSPTNLATNTGGGVRLNKPAGQYGMTSPVAVPVNPNQHASASVAVGVPMGTRGAPMPFGSIPGPSTLTMPGAKPGEQVLIQATPCGTLGFAPPEVLKAFNDAKDKSNSGSARNSPASKADSAGTSSPTKNPGGQPQDFPSEPAGGSNSKRTGNSRRGNSPPHSESRVVQPATAGGESSSPQPKEDVVHRTANAPLVPMQSMKKTDIFAAGVTLSILLTGCEPFPSNSSKALVEAVNKGLRFGKHWAHVSKDARLIISQMLKPKEEERPTAREVLESPWLRSLMPQIASTPSSLTNSIVSNTTDVREALAAFGAGAGASATSGQDSGISPLSNTTLSGPPPIQTPTTPTDQMMNGGTSAHGTPNSQRSDGSRSRSPAPGASGGAAPLILETESFELTTATATSSGSGRGRGGSPVGVRRGSGGPVMIPSPTRQTTSPGGGGLSSILTQNPPPANAAIVVAIDGQTDLDDYAFGASSPTVTTADAELFATSIKNLRKGAAPVYATDVATGSITLGSRQLAPGPGQGTKATSSSTMNYSSTHEDEDDGDSVGGRTSSQRGSSGRPGALAVAGGSPLCMDCEIDDDGDYLPEYDDETHNLVSDATTPMGQRRGSTAGNSSVFANNSSPSSSARTLHSSSFTTTHVDRALLQKVANAQQAGLSSGSDRSMNSFNSDRSERGVPDSLRRRRSVPDSPTILTAPPTVLTAPRAPQATSPKHTSVFAEPGPAPILEVKSSGGGGKGSGAGRRGSGSGPALGGPNTGFVESTRSCDEVGEDFEAGEQ